MEGQIAFILWRESIEALLVVGILASWIARRGAGPRARLALWGGVAAGFGVALGFAALVLGFSALLTDRLRSDLMTAMVFLAAMLIVQMVVWMRRHGRGLKREMEAGLDAAAGAGSAGTVSLLALIAVAREGSETVVFLYGTLAAADSASLLPALAAAAAGLAAAAATYGALRLGSRLLPWRRFFRISEAMLLLLGCALVTAGVGELVQSGLVEPGAALWNTGWLLDDMGGVGGVVAALTGYRAAPDALTVAAWVLYWLAVRLLLGREARPAVARPG